MAGKASWTAPIGMLMAGTLLLCAVPAAAQDEYENFKRAQAQEAEANTAMSQAIADGNAGRSDEACRGFKAAKSLYTRADFALPSLSTDANMIRATRNASKELQSKADLAGKYARMACGQ